MNIAITGAAGRIAYSLIPILCSGGIFGARRINLRLLDIESSGSILIGVKKEIEDCCYEAIDEVTITTDPRLAFSNLDIAIILGGYPRLPGMERKDLISRNAEGMLSQAKALDEYASKDCKVLVVANPANTNCLVAMKSAMSIPAKNFTCLTRLDHERLKGMLAHKVNEVVNRKGKFVYGNDIKNVCIFGNHSNTQVPYTAVGRVFMEQEDFALSDFIEEQMEQLTMNVQNRGAEIIQFLKSSSAMSAANAIAKHLKDWLGVNPTDEIFSMGILSDGNTYGIPDDLVFSFPCRRIIGTAPGEVEIVPNWPIDSTIQSMLTRTTNELLEEKIDALLAIGLQQSVQERT